MNVTHDIAESKQLQLEMPQVPRPLECLALRPGTGVKSYDPAVIEATNRGQDRIVNMPACGRVLKNEDDECVVIGYGWTDEPCETFVWRGTKAEFEQLWRID